MEYKIYNSLPHGSHNAVNADYLCTLFGFRSNRELRQHVQRERMAGALIASGDTGYYIPENTFAMLKCARAALRQCENQIEFE